MNATARAEAETLPRGRHMEALEEAFRALAAGTTFKDQSSRFLTVLRAYFDPHDVMLLRRSSGIWERLGGGTGAAPQDLPSPAGGLSTASVREENSVRAVQLLSDRSELAVVLSRADRHGGFGEHDVAALRLFLSVFSNAYREQAARRYEKELIFSLNHRVLQLNSLIDTGIEVSRLSDETPPHHLALQRAASLTNASCGVLRVERGGSITEEVRFPHGSAEAENAPEGRRISASFDFGGDRYTFQLFDKESRSGPIPFEETDQLLLDALSRQVHGALENRFLHQEALEKQKIDQDIAVAASIQQRLIPRSLPAIAGYDIAGINIPSKSVGGDYYDCLPLGGGRYALVIADVAGKGVPAALLVSSFHAYLTAYLESPIPVVELAGRLNRVIAKTSTEDKFITAFFALLDPSTGSLEAVSAGHNPVFLRRADGTLQELSLGGIPLGMLDIDFPYQSETLTLAAGDRLLLYTDGIPEAVNGAQTLYEAESPLREFVRDHVPPQAGQFIQELIADVRRFTGSAPQADDITALYLLRGAH